MTMPVTPIRPDRAAVALPSARFFYLYVCITGAAVMMLEFAASRVVAPWFGSSIFVWGNIIGAILIALSLGYYYGGKLADKHPDMRTLTSIVYGAGLFVSVIPLLVFWLTRNISLFDLYSGSSVLVTIIGSFLVIAILFAFPVGLLGMVSPFVIRLATTKVEAAGSVAGGLYAWSTLGSILGTFGAAFILIPLLGSRETIILSAVGLLAIAAAGLRSKPWLWFGLALPLAVYAVVGQQPLRASAATVTQVESMYQFIEVSDSGDRLNLQFNEGLGTQSYYMKEGVLTDSYYDSLALVPSLLAPQRVTPQAVVLGLAGGTLTRQLREFYPEYQITGVEIDPEVVRLANEHFALAEQNVDVQVQDARQFLRASEQSYDIIYVDAFANEYYIPWHLTTVEFFETALDHLTPGGVVAMNIGSARENSPLLQAFIATLGQVFTHVYIAQVPESFNYVVVASQTPLTVNPLVGITDERYTFASILRTNWHEVEPQTTATVLTDNRAPIELYTEGMIWDYLYALQ